MTTAPEPPLNGPSSASPSVVGTRPFGAHLSMRWWVSVVLTIVVVAAIYGLQLILGGIAAVVEFGLLGKDPDDASLTPLTVLAINLSTILVAPLALLVLAKAGRVPWRSALSVGRAFRWRRLGGATSEERLDLVDERVVARDRRFDLLVAEVRAVLADGEAGPVRGLLEVEEDGQASVGVRLIRQGHREVRRSVHLHVLTAPLDPHAGRRSSGPHRSSHRHDGTGVQCEVPHVRV